MSALNLSHQHKIKRQVVKTPKQCEHKRMMIYLKSFSLPHYFQHIHERTDNVHQELAELKIYVNRLEIKLDTLLMLLARCEGDSYAINDLCVA
jgi:hypothetical protein